VFTQQSVRAKNQIPETETLQGSWSIKHQDQGQSSCFDSLSCEWGRGGTDNILQNVSAEKLRHPLKQAFDFAQIVLNQEDGINRATWLQGQCCNRVLISCGLHQSSKCI
jgi:hypothetical protein